MSSTARAGKFVIRSQKYRIASSCQAMESVNSEALYYLKVDSEQ